MSARDKKFSMILAAGAMAVSISTGHAAESGERGSSLPNTPAGRVAKAFFSAFNSGDDKQMRSFEAQHRAASSLKSRSIDDRIEQYHELREIWGELSVDGVFDSGDTELTLGVVANRTDDFLTFRFELESQPPQKLVAVYIEAGGPRPEVAVAGASRELSQETRYQAIARIADILEKSYVFPDVGAKMSSAIRANLANGDYADLSTTAKFAMRLTQDLRGICHDKHLSIVPDAVSEHDHKDGDESDDWRLGGSWNNFGFEEAKRLAGNVGYIKLGVFSPSEDAKAVAASAMNFLANCGALIFDLRENSGGSPEMIALLSGYLFDESVHLNSFYNRKDDMSSETWSDKNVPGQLFGSKKPVYVLTSKYTFSAAEEFTYNLKNLGRATVVGETTGGGAHPVERERISDAFSMMVPYARAINPITKTNWEGVGVKPDLPSRAGDALAVAHADALRKLISQGKNASRTKELERALRRVGAK